MKKKFLIGAGAIVLMTALIVTVALRDAGDGDLALLKDVNPFASSTQLYLSSSLPDREVRMYSLHVVYDEAVKSLKNDLGRSGWTWKTTYAKAILTSPSRYESIIVERGRVTDMDDVKSSSSHHFRFPPNPLLEPSPNPRVWVMVTTRRKINLIETLREKLREQTKETAPAKSFAIRYMAPSSGSPWQLVDIDKGTDHLEGTRVSARVFSSP
jgi:hypothetical protein